MVVKKNDVVLISNEMRDYFNGDATGILKYNIHEEPNFSGKQIIGLVVDVKPSSPEVEAQFDEHSICMVQINELGLTTNINSLWLKVIE